MYACAVCVCGVCGVSCWDPAGGGGHVHLHIVAPPCLAWRAPRVELEWVQVQPGLDQSDLPAEDGESEGKPGQQASKMGGLVWVEAGADLHDVGLDEALDARELQVDHCNVRLQPVAAERRVTSRFSGCCKRGRARMFWMGGGS